jgi:Fic family protein
LNKRSRLGSYVSSTVAGETVRAFVPPPLPPQPGLELESLALDLSEADRAVGRLDGIASMLPEQGPLLYMYARKEAVLSSQIEGTQSSLADLLRYESAAEAGDPIDDLREVSNYVDAMAHARERLTTLPLSLRLIREMHARLMRSGRGRSKLPGEFRTTQNWIGGSRPGNASFVPPPPQAMMRCLGEFESFIHDETVALPPLVRAGLLHVQFETIHPFLDGNGRVGRLLITVYLLACGALRQPLLYLSLYFKQHRSDYYRLLNEVRERGAWEAWLEFFLDGIRASADDAVTAAMRIIELFEADRARILAAGGGGTALRLFEQLKTQPYSTAAAAAERLRSTVPTVIAALAVLERLGVIQEVTGRRRGRVYAYGNYLAILNEGAEPL